MKGVALYAKYYEYDGDDDLDVFCLVAFQGERPTSLPANIYIWWQEQ